MYVTRRDLDYLWETGYFGLSTTDLAFQRHYKTREGVTPRYAQRRIRQFCKAGWIKRHTFTINVGAGPRKLPNILRLTEPGADFVELQTGRRPPRWGRGELPTARTVIHRVNVVRCLLAWTDACRAADAAVSHLYLEQDTYPSFNPKSAKANKHVIYESFTVGCDVISVCPDAVLGITLPARDAARCWTLYAAIEYDNSTEGSRFLHKLPGYRLLLDPQERHYKRHVPEADLCRVYVICNTQERLANLRFCLTDKPGCEPFRFATLSDVEGFALTDPIWWDVRGKKRAIIDRLPSDR